MARRRTNNPPSLIRTPLISPQQIPQLAPPAPVLPPLISYQPHSRLHSQRPRPRPIAPSAMEVLHLPSPLLPTSRAPNPTSPPLPSSPPSRRKEQQRLHRPLLIATGVLGRSRYVKSTIQPEGARSLTSVLIDCAQCVRDFRHRDSRLIRQFHHRLPGAARCGAGTSIPRLAMSVMRSGPSPSPPPPPQPPSTDPPTPQSRHQSQQTPPRSLPPRPRRRSEREPARRNVHRARSRRPSTPAQRRWPCSFRRACARVQNSSALTLAAHYGRTEVVAFLLDYTHGPGRGGDR